MTKTPRPVRIDGDVAYVTLTKGYVALIDAADVPLVDGVCWQALVGPKTVYAMRMGPRPQRKGILMHRVLMGDPEGLEIDHIDGNGLNNRRRGKAKNLRIASQAENRQNSCIRRHNTSGLKGVSFHKPLGKWRAQIAKDGKNMHIGLFGCITAAHLAYAKASAKLHGEYGRLK